MKIGILGTGMVGRAHAGKLAELGHDVAVGTRNVALKMAETAPDEMGNPPFGAWHKDHDRVRLVPFAQAASHGEIVLHAISGDAALDVLVSLKDELRGKVLIDISNPLDFSRGMPPSLFVSNTDSLAERIQRTLPEVRVVKSLNTVTAPLQVQPALLAGGNHHVFVSGNDAQAKADAKKILGEYGWTHILDLGDIATARGAEMYLLLWLELWGALGSPLVSVLVQTGPQPAS